ncbi:hypothetical protein K461DRAFT_297586 [Myriangium duriaei CBS 260.36]|uniref:UBZ3-type domain-containing protein n=1 Tax=Myriangium duriaei CBS 260.36 TaxID=1168546 RepID=A0A9P4ISC6_9PEZI|nr:hypothetical protein K461DRAFT_297586 [Myriangium duriaei CBS 260.36]
MDSGDVDIKSMPETVDGTLQCDRCGEQIPARAKTEHDDWHLAKDLQEQDEPQHTGAASPASVQPSHHPAAQNPKHHVPDKHTTSPDFAPPSYAPPSTTSQSTRNNDVYSHSNQVIQAGHVRARDERLMQNTLQNLQYQYRIYNSDIEPEHETDFPCSCPIHQYQWMKWRRYGVQDMWSKAVMYPGERAYNDDTRSATLSLFSNNPYRISVVSPYGYPSVGFYGIRSPQPYYHAQALHQTIALNNRLNAQAQADIDGMEPKVNIWDESDINHTMANLGLNSKGGSVSKHNEYEKGKGKGEKSDWGMSEGKTNDEAESSVSSPTKSAEKPSVKGSKLTSFRKSLGIKTSEERSISRFNKAVEQGRAVRNAILAEEAGRWPNNQWRDIVTAYQEKVGMTRMIADLRRHKPYQYLHMLRAGYFEPIPVAWATQDSNPLKFSIEAAAGWRGITPAWRGYEDTAEERLYWVLNHREGSVGMRMKPDFISEMNMAQARMATAVPPPPEYFSPNDTCHLQHTSDGYSKQVMPSPFRPADRPEVPTDDTMILLDVSGSMDFDSVRPIYTQYMITRYAPSMQPKNKDVAKAIVRRFTDAMASHDHNFGGYDLTTFANEGKYIGTLNNRNFDAMWRNVRIGGGTRVMTGWQMVKDLHFRKHSHSAIHHPIYGWQAGPDTPMLRLLLLLDGEAADMDEFELDLLGLSWAHVTIFLVGPEGDPHHHRHANELQRISDVNHHVSFVDAQGNTPERFVTHELLKRHLGYEISMSEFVEMETPPPYVE